MAEEKDLSNKTILFDASKREVCTPQSGFKQFHRRLRTSYKVAVNKDELTLDKLREASIVIFGGPRDKYTTAEFDAMKTYMQEGGNIMIMLGEGGETKFGTNINYFTEEFGVAVNRDSVVRTVYYKYLHPKEVLIQHGILNKELNKSATKKTTSSATDSLFKSGSDLNFVYPYGASLAVAKPAFPVLSSGHIAYPLNRPICAFFAHKNGSGRLAVLGSVAMFDDNWLDKEENSKLMDVVVRWLLGSEAHPWGLDPHDAEEPDVSEYHHLPDTEALAERVRCCLQESEEVTKDFTTLFDDTLFKFDTSLIPEAVDLYSQLDLKHEPLSLIPPQFETPLPPLQPSVFPPTLREPPPPACDLLDLDEQFASERVRLAHLTNKCNDDDLDYFIRESGEILGVNSKLKPEHRDAKHVLDYIFKQVCAWKKLNQEPEAMAQFRELNGMPALEANNPHPGNWQE